MSTNKHQRRNHDGVFLIVALSLGILVGLGLINMDREAKAHEDALEKRIEKLENRIESC